MHSANMVMLSSGGLNMGGAQYDADEILQKIKDKQREREELKMSRMEEGIKANREEQAKGRAKRANPRDEVSVKETTGEDILAQIRARCAARDEAEKQTENKLDAFDEAMKIVTEKK